jgi:hypothetical protein
MRVARDMFAKPTRRVRGALNVEKTLATSRNKEDGLETLGSSSEGEGERWHMASEADIFGHSNCQRFA